MIRNVEVLVVGAGPTGLTLALELARRGVPHAVIDLNEAPATGSRGKGLQPRSLEVLDDLGVIDEILATSTTGQPLRLHQGRELVVELGTAARARPGVPYPSLVLLPEWRVEQVLRERLVGFGGKVEYGAGLVSFEQDGEGVVAELGNGETVGARYLVGCDGGHSTVRRLLGATLEGRTHEDQYFLVGDVTVDGLDSDAAYAWFGDGGSYLALSPLPNAEGAWQFQANVLPGPDGSVREPTLETFRLLFRERSGRTDVTLREATWLSRYRFNARMVSDYRHGRVFLAGDAAHVHSPAGGQGMNTGIQDAYNLGWKLAAVLGGAPDQLLDSYSCERVPVAAKVLADSSRGFESVFALRGARRFLRDHVIFPLVRRPAVMSRLLARTDQLGIAYRHSPLTVASGPRGGVRPGDRAPDARGTTADGAPARLFDFTRGPHWTVLGFGAEAARGLAVLERGEGPGIGVRTCLAVRSGRGDLVGPEAADLYGARDGTLVLIRPDGHLALRTEDPEVVVGYLDRGCAAP
ncbi:FAD-dependent monooxygenase [Actinomycetota bacterium Odt1-20B]